MRPITTATAPELSSLHRRHYQAIPAKQLSVDPTMQRELKQVLLNKIGDYNPDLAGAMIVSHRRDGSRILLDGQHRWERAMAADPDIPLDCIVHTGLTHEEEAIIFLKTNVTRMSVSKYDIYRISIEAGDEIALSVQRQLAARDLEMAKSASTNRVGAVTACNAVVVMDAEEADLLEIVLTIMEEAWGRTKDTWDGNLIRGIAETINRNLDEIDLDRLRSVLASRPVEQWKQELFKNVGSSMGSESRPFTMAKVIMERYNNRLRTKGKIFWIPPKK